MKTEPQIWEMIRQVEKDYFASCYSVPGSTEILAGLYWVLGYRYYSPGHAVPLWDGAADSSEAGKP